MISEVVPEIRKIAGSPHLDCFDSNFLSCNTLAMSDLYAVGALDSRSASGIKRSVDMRSLRESALQNHKNLVNSSEKIFFYLSKQALDRSGSKQRLSIPQNGEAQSCCDLCRLLWLPQ